MTGHTGIAETAALVGDPARANMLAAVLDGRALTATELAFAAGVSPATASEHLGKLTAGGLLQVSRQGRHRYFGLASPEVARMLESLMVVADATRADSPRVRRAVSRVPPGLVACRTCYDHLAGRVAVAIADALVARNALVLTPEAGEVTPEGEAFLAGMGLDVGPSRAGARPLCRPCLDWSERRPHVAGRLGAAILGAALSRDWVRHQKAGRAVDVTPAGWQALSDLFGISRHDLETA